MRDWNNVYWEYPDNLEQKIIYEDLALFRRFVNIADFSCNI